MATTRLDPSTILGSVVDIGPNVSFDDDFAAARIVADAGLTDAGARKGTSGILPIATLPANAGVGLGNSALVEALLSAELVEPSEQAASSKAALAEASARKKGFFMQFSVGTR